MATLFAVLLGTGGLLSGRTALFRLSMPTSKLLRSKAGQTAERTKESDSRAETRRLSYQSHVLGRNSSFARSIC